MADEKSPTYLTPKGAKTLREELKNLIEVERPALALRLRDAIQMGDLKENADYHAAKEQQGFIEGRILEIETMLRNAVLLDDDNSDTNIVRVGHKVTIVELDSDDEETYMLVGPAEADPGKGRISNESPIGQALLGKRIGQTIEVQAPGGEISFEVKKIEHAH